MKAVRFDRGTLELATDAPDVPNSIWDPRSQTRRVAAFRFSSLIAHATRTENELPSGDLRRAWKCLPRETARLGLRPYQAQALASWTAFGRQGVVVLPTGAGKTRVALAAMYETGLPTAILCPTKALAEGWLQELRRNIPDEPIGLVGDGQRSVERITVLTFESAYRHMDRLGDRFGLLVVDEVHHFGSGARIEALEASAATARLGLTATAPDAGSEGANRLTELVGPVVFELDYADLAGRHLAPVTMVKVPVRLDANERSEYDTRNRAFQEMRRTFMRLYPGADITTMLQAFGRTLEGRKALRDHARALELAGFPTAKRSLLRTLLERHRDDRTIVFTAFAENAYVAAQDNLIPVITGETSAKERQDILTSFREGKVRAIASARVLNEGIDVPEARVAIIVAGTLGPREHVQRIGRVLRPAPDKHALVYELITMGTSDAWRAARRAKHAPHPSP